MPNDEFTIPALAAATDKKQSQQFWQRALYIYAAIEMLIIIIQYSITRSKCTDCTMAPAYYFFYWLQHLLFTGLLWYCLNKVYDLKYWKIALLNIFFFAAYYFLWTLLQYATFHMGRNWLVPEKIYMHSFGEFVYKSWADIGKYALKLSAFYVLKFYFEYRRAEKRRVQLAVINKDMQLNLMKQQLSPHFYFNTLNNLYGLARSNNEKLSGALHQLSNIMQYVIVDCNQSKVLLDQEIKFLQSYIALEKLRYEQHTLIEMKVEGITRDQMILPLMLIQFVENAFKHGMKEKSDKNWMKVSVVIGEEELCFKVDNSYYETSSTAGIGINSVKQILALQYEGKHTMQLLNENNRFSVNLKLNLT